jgi:hypothetical protein
MQALENQVFTSRHMLRVLTGSSMSAFNPLADVLGTKGNVSFVPILLQKSKVASVRIFSETLKREAIDDSNDLSRITEVAYEFSVRR